MIRGGLFTRYYLEEGIQQAAPYRALQAQEVAEFADFTRDLWTRLATMSRPNEAETENKFIYPMLDRLGWRHLPQQEPGKGRKDIADALLFLDQASEAKAMQEPDKAARFRHGVVVVENEARDTLLDRASGKAEAPSSQILRYLPRAESSSNGACAWGLLTNARAWRLYWHFAPSRAEGYVEFDLEALLNTPPAPPPGADEFHWLRVFLLLFRRDAFIPSGVTAKHFLDEVLAEGKRYEERVTAALTAAVFKRIFPGLMQAICQESSGALPDDPVWRANAREAGLKLLYRLLFLFYAEDRDLLPVHHPGYFGYSLRVLRDDAAKIIDGHVVVSPRSRNWWSRLTTLFRAIAEGDPSLGLPPYNGGLFDDAASPFLANLNLSDASLAPLIDEMSREGDATHRRMINYRDLSVQHLGSIYEGLLEQDIAPDGAGGILLRPNAFSRKTTGSYYTPEELVKLIIRRTVGPLLAERRAAFATRNAQLEADKRTKAEREKILLALDPAEAFVNLRICDPAMGSGHFLVSLVDYLTDEVLKATADASKDVTWVEYRSPLAIRIENLRKTIHAQAAQNNWPLREDQLDDKHLARRIILKRVIYGVDMNPMAVELAKLSLWLHSFTVGAPLSFLDHHLRLGDSLFGEFVGPVGRELQSRYGLVKTNAITSAAQSAAGMAMVERLTDSDIGEVKQSEAAFAGVEEATADLRALLNLYHAARWLPPQTAAENVSREALFGESYGDLIKLAKGTAPKPPKADAMGLKWKKEVVTAKSAYNAATNFLSTARALAAERKFLHWEAAFPGVWEDWQSSAPRGGFDAVIGNPPWDKVEIDDVTWFRSHAPEFIGREKVSKALLRAGITTHKKMNSLTWQDYLAAQKLAHDAIEVARMTNYFPDTSDGRADLFALFVERGVALLSNKGRLGLLVPTGLVADRRTAKFFQNLVKSKRVAAILDFENRLGVTKPQILKSERKAKSKPVLSANRKQQREKFFTDVDPRFKFCVFAALGTQLSSDSIDCGSFLTADDAINENESYITLGARDFLLVNPNTGTAPFFRTQRDADIILALYRNFPILETREPSNSNWPLDFSQMFNLRTDRENGKFQTAEELLKKGFYRVKGTWFEKGEESFVPVFVGRMIHQFDSRYASVTTSDEAEENDSVGERTLVAQYKQSDYHPEPLFWVAQSELPLFDGLKWLLVYRDITNPTNARTSIATIIYKSGAGHTLPVLGPKFPKNNGYSRADILSHYINTTPLLVANLNSFICDYIVRQKVQTTHLSWYILQQIPIIPFDAYKHRFGPKTAAEIIKDDVLHLTYVSHDMQPFAQDQGFSGPPFAWDEEDRLRRRARLDAIFFHLYGIAWEDADYILSTFPIVQREEISKFGRFRSRDLIRAYMAALTAGAPDAPVEG